MLEVDELLTQKADFGSGEYLKAKSEILKNVVDISALLPFAKEGELTHFVTSFFKLKNRVVPLPIVEDIIKESGEYLNYLWAMLPLLTTIETVHFITTEADILKLFLGFCKKTKFSAAELGDEENEYFLKACVNIIDYSFFEELESRDISINNMNIKFSETIDEEFKKSLWEKIDIKLELLKHLKDEVFADEGLFKAELENVSIAQSSTVSSVSDSPAA